MKDLFEGLVAVVQYSRKDEVWWNNMAAFDSKNVAEKCAKDSSSGDNSPWNYRVVDVPTEESK